MNHKKLQFLVPQYKETEEVISVLLDSIEHQVEIDKKEIGVIICSDGGNYVLDSKFLGKYSYDIDYTICKHRGVSGARNSALLLSDADYIMFCDADDYFCNVLGIRIIFENIDLNEKKNEPFDLMSSKFYLEGFGDKWSLNIMEHNNTYIHGRVYRREFLIKNCQYFNEKIWANEDCFFNIMTGMYAKNTKYLNIPVYCWKGNPDSVSHDPKFLMKTLHQLLYSNDSVVEVMQQLNKPKKEIARIAFDVICKLYLDMNKPCWYQEENKEYLDITIKTLQWYIQKRGILCAELDDTEKKNILNEARKTEHYANIEGIAFNDFIKKIMAYGTEQK